MKIVIDTLGCDYPKKVIKGSLMALAKDKELEIILTGKKTEINKVIQESKIKVDDRLTIVDCKTAITNEDAPTEAIREKNDSSLVKAFDLLKNDNDVVGLISAGSTGAVLTGTYFKIGRIRGISRPALTPVLPTADPNTKVVIADCGANVDCKPINLCHFAIMGSVYMQTMFGVKKPRVALLSNGVEDKKGNALTKEVFTELSNLPINFVGNMEARDALSGKYDVIVCDGFDGNILLKSIEGAVKFTTGTIKKEIKKNFFSMIGSIFMSGTFRKLKKSLNYHNYGGSPFMGARKIVIKAHGSSDENSIIVCIKQVENMYKNELCKKIEQQVSKLVVSEE